MKNIGLTKEEKKKNLPKSCQKHLQEGSMSALNSAYTETGD